MNNNLTQIVIILDESGSMEKTREDTIGGLNNFIREQKELEGEANIEIVTFSSTVRTSLENTNIKDVSRFDKYRPSGLTALNDAIGITVDKLGKRLYETPEEERPGKVILVIITDGLENKSMYYTTSTVKEMIEHQTNKYNWNFIYLGANQDAFAESSNLGIYNYSNYKATPLGTGALYGAISTTVCTYRSTGTIPELDENVKERSDIKC